MSSPLSFVTKENLFILLKLARPRTWFFIYYSYVIGWNLQHTGLSHQFVIGMIICIVSTGNVNLLNAYTDIEEDKVNLPHRVEMIRKLGLSNLLKSVVISYIFASILVLFMPWGWVAVYVVSLFTTIFYSVAPLRFKARPLMSMIAFSGAVFLPLAASWTLGKGLLDLPVLCYFLGYMFFTYCTLKNLPDYDGDLNAGLVTSATVFRSKTLAGIVAGLLLLSVHFVLYMLISHGLVEQKYQLLWVLVPVVFYLGYVAVVGKGYDELEKLHTMGLLYVVVFLVLTLLITAPNLGTVFFVVGTLVIQFNVLARKIDSR